MPTILVTGAGGQLGREFAVLASEHPEWRFHLIPRAEVDIDDAAATRALFERLGPDYCINCAAYTAVDRAESEPEAAFRINEVAAGHLAEQCREYGTHLVHFSTDYVYRGDKNRPLRESDEAEPVSVYAASKQAGEVLILRTLPAATIIRTSWLYSSFGHNFLRTMQRYGREREELRVVYDQVGTPTYARDLAAAVLHIVDRLESGRVTREKAGGIFNYSNEGVTSWYDFALAILELSNISCRVVPIESKDFPTPVERPHYSVLNKDKIKRTFGLEIPHWREALVRCIGVRSEV